VVCLIECVHKFFDLYFFYLKKHVEKFYMFRFIMCWYFQFNPYSYNFFLNTFINILLFLILLQVDIVFSFLFFNNFGPHLLVIYIYIYSHLILLPFFPV
jgi:hypothetical protein